MESKNRKEKITRRDFLRSTSTAAVGAAGLVTLGAPAILRAQNLNSRITLGMVGTGSRGCHILRCMQKTNKFLVTDVCDIYPPHLQEGKRDSANDKVRTYEQWEKMLDLKDMDSVVISPPLFLHVPMSVAFLQAGKHVLSEKSMGLTIKQLNQMIEADKNSDKVYMVGYQSRLMDSFAEAKRLVQSGSIGKVTQFYVHYDRNQTWRKEDVDPKWERVLNWRLYKEYCGGMLTEVITHEIDQVLDILGTMPVRAACNGEIMVYKDGREHHDSIMGVYEMEDGVLGVATGHLANSRWGGSWAMLGTHGTIEYVVEGLRIFWEKETRHLDTADIKHAFTQTKLGQSLNITESPSLTPAKMITFQGEDYVGSTVREVEHFADCIINNKTPIMDAASTRRPSIAALMAYHSSMNNGKVVTRQEIEALG